MLFSWSVLEIRLVFLVCGQALQRDHASVENIVRLVMEAGPVITGVITDVEVPPRTGNFFSKGAEVETTTSVDRDVMFKEKEESEASPFESLTLQSSLKVATGTEEYAMSAPVAADVRLLTFSRTKHYCFGIFRFEDYLIRRELSRHSCRGRHIQSLAMSDQPLFAGFVTTCSFSKGGSATRDGTGAVIYVFDSRSHADYVIVIEICMLVFTAGLIAGFQKILTFGVCSSLERRSQRKF